MPDGRADSSAHGSAERAALASDERLVRDVRRRLVLLSGGSTLVVLVALGILLYAAVARSLDATGTAQLEDRMRALRTFVERPDRQPGDAPIDLVFGGGSSGTVAVIVGPNGRPIGRRLLPIPEGLPHPASVREARASGRDLRTSEIGDIPVRVLSETVRGPNGREFVVQVVGDRTAEQRTLTVLLVVLVVGGGLALVVAAAFGTTYARRALVPIRHSLAAQRAALGRQRQFAADASHELRTPLTIIRSSVDHLRRHSSEPVAAVGDALEDIDAEVAHLTGLVDDLLLLARSDSGAISLAREPADLGDVAADGASSLAAPAAQRRVEIAVDPAPAIVVGDPVRLRQLVTILVDNAVRHAPEGGHVAVIVRAGGGVGTLVVEDDGPGIREEHLSRVFDRFWRAPGSGDGGTGLGLAIAAWIVERHAGRIGVANRPEGGARFTVELPLAGGGPGAADGQPLASPGAGQPDRAADGAAGQRGAV